MANEIKTANDMKSLDEFRSNISRLVRGETPIDIKQKCLHLCQNYLSGNWMKQSVTDIEFRRVSGGLTNQLYYCAIAGTGRCADGLCSEPQEVAIRLYGKKHFNNFEENERLTDVVIAQLVSDNGLGPKLYGVFESGQIQAYYEHKQFRENERNDPKLVNQLSTMLAQVHAMDVPIKKSHNWLFDTYRHFYAIANQKFCLKDLISEYNCQTLKDFDLNAEIDWLEMCTKSTNSPIVFCHNDFRGSNIMITESEPGLKRIVLCDFEYSSYGYRGFDFGTIIRDWAQSESGFVVLPEDSEIKSFIETYICESERIFGKEFSENVINSVDHILNEVKIFVLVLGMFRITFGLKSGESEDDLFRDKRLSMEMSESGLKNYLHFKKQLIEQNLVQNTYE